MPASHVRPLGRALAVQFRRDTGQILPFDWLADDQPVEWRPADEARIMEKVAVNGFPGYTHHISKVDEAAGSRSATHWLVIYDA